MANNNKTKMGVLSTAFGIIFLIIGVTLTFYELMLSFNIESGGMKYAPHLFEYPYQFVGVALFLAGVVLLIVGVYLWRTKS